MATPSATPDSAPGRRSQPRWSGRMRGGYFGNWFFVQVIRWLGLRWAYAWLVFVATYFTLAAPRSFRCSVDYLRRVLGPQPAWKWPLLVWRHFFSFGITLLDRVAVIMNRGRIQCRFEGEDLFRAYLDQGQGVILLGAHLGSWEIGGHLLGRRLGRPVNLVVLEREEQRIRQLFAGALADRQFRLLTTDESPLRSVPILAALRRGEIVALLGDRSFGQADVLLPFLGGIARFPSGPFRLAAASGAPVFQVFVVRERLGHYRFVSYPPECVPRDLLRAPPDALEPCLTGYARTLETMARQYPFQWYNIYPYWEPAPPPTTFKASTQSPP